jgi:hypothetical protein
MPTYSATLVRKPRKEWFCALCHHAMRQHLRLFGCGAEGDKPYRMRICLDCARGTSDPVTRRALAETP